MKRAILQIFNRYLNVGGEEQFTRLLAGALESDYDVDTYAGSTEALLGNGILGRVKAPLKAWHNDDVVRDLRRMQAEKRYAVWIIHNVMPALSPAVYTTAFELGVPIVHYLHNFRLMCANGLLLNHGEPCERCLNGNFMPAFTTACWRNDRIASGMMGLILKRVRALDVFGRVDAWIALNQHQKRKHVEVGVPDERIHVVSNFVEMTPDVPMSNAKGDVLYLGRLSHEKGLVNLIHAWSRIDSRGRRLRIAGSGDEEGRLRALVGELGLNSVVFLGPVPREKHAQLWGECAFSVIPSICHDVFPLALLESWMNGRAVVASRLGGCGEIIDQRRDGLLVEPYSVDSLAQGLQEMIDDPDGVAAMGEGGRRRVLTEFSRDVWLSNVRRVLDGVIHSAPAHA
ncbi:MAG: glycosyltransferase family 4 protein [Chloroflexi bacterium]|nr:glycosyltransferase family 4 protein [Chloroflexota bacterium]